MTRRSEPGRRGVILLFALVVLALSVMFIAIMTTYSAQEIAHERRAMLNSAADQALQSARAWVRANGASLTAPAAREVAIDELLSPGVSGKVELRRAADAVTMVECRVVLERGRTKVTRRAELPLLMPGR